MILRQRVCGSDLIELAHRRMGTGGSGADQADLRAGNTLSRGGETAVSCVDYQYRAIVKRKVEKNELASTKGADKVTSPSSLACCKRQTLLVRKQAFGIFTPASRGPRVLDVRLFLLDTVFGLSLAHKAAKNGMLGPGREGRGARLLFGPLTIQCRLE